MDDESSDDEEFAQELQAVELGVPTEQQPKKTVFINNKMALLSKLAEVRLGPSVPWIEKLDFVCARPLDVDNAQDDLKREAAFYAATLGCAKTAILQFDQARIPYMRPADFFAEMIKPDSQMQRIKDSLLNEKARMDLSAARRKQKDQKKFAQEVHANKLKDRSKAKKNFVEGLKTAPRAPAEERSLVGPINEALREGKQKQAKGKKTAGSG
jgi:rRNA-processing protein EBP2